MKIADPLTLLMRDNDKYNISHRLIGVTDPAENI